MSSSGIKRKRYSDIKNMLVNDLHKLTVDSGDLNNDLLAANGDFARMFKSMEDRQSQHLTQALIIEEKYREITCILKEGEQARVGEPSPDVLLPPAYCADIRKFLGDSSTSLEGHAKMLKDQVGDMEALYQDFDMRWKNKLNELKARAEQIVQVKSNLKPLLLDFKNNMGSESD